MIEKVYKMSTRIEHVIEPVIKDDYIHYMHMVLLKDQALPTHSTNANIYMTVVTGTMHISLMTEISEFIQREHRQYSTRHQNDRAKSRGRDPGADRGQNPRSWE